LGDFARLQERFFTMAKLASRTSKPAAASKAVGFVASSALSLDVGEKAVKAFKGVDTALNTAKDNIERAERGKRETLKDLTQAFTKAALNDKRIVLADQYSDEKKVIEAMNERLRVAIGIKVVQRGEDGTEKIVLAPWTADLFPQPGEDRKSDAWQAKETFRGNFGAIFKKAVLAAEAIISTGMKVREAKDGTLMISGPKIKEHFKVDEVALNEKRKIKEGDVVKELPKTPSYTEIGRIGAALRGENITTRADSRAKLGGAALTEGDLVKSAKALQSAIVKIKNFSDSTASALEALADTIEKALEANEGTDAAA
jgi:hypothetical protein